MIVPRLRFSGVVKLPAGAGVGRRGIGRIRGRRRIRWSHIIGFGRFWRMFGGRRFANKRIEREARSFFGAHLTIDLVAAHHVSQRKKNAGKEQHEHEQADDMPAFEHTLTCSAFSPRRHSLFRLASQRLDPLINNIDRQRKHNRCVLLDTYFGECLQIAKLDGGRLGLQNLCSLGELG
jgi:uncharacterized protein YdaU (DUF1376 family)